MFGAPLLKIWHNTTGLREIARFQLPVTAVEKPLALAFSQLLSVNQSLKQHVYFRELRGIMD